MIKSGIFVFFLALSVFHSSLAQTPSAPYNNNTNLAEYVIVFCLRIQQIPAAQMALYIREMEATQYSPDEYFMRADCQPAGYPSSIKSPILHLVADDPEARIYFLRTVWAYYSIKRKQPDQFAQVVNAKNTKGETLLDYIESFGSKETRYTISQMPYVDALVTYICERGGRYEYVKTKTCR